MDLEEALAAFLHSLDDEQCEYFHKHRNDADLEDQLMDLINANQFYLYQAWAALAAEKVPKTETVEQLTFNPIPHSIDPVNPPLNGSNTDITMSYETFKKIMDETAQLKVDLALLQKKYYDLKELTDRDVLKSECVFEKNAPDPVNSVAPKENVSTKSKECQTNVDVSREDSEVCNNVLIEVCKQLSRLLAGSFDTSSFMFSIHLLARISTHVKDHPNHREPLEDRGLIQAVVNVMNNNSDHYSIVHYGCSYLYRITENSSKPVEHLVTLNGMECLENCFRKNLKNEFNNLQASEAIMLIFVTISNETVYRKLFMEETLFNLFIFGVQFEDSILIRMRSAFILIRMLAEGPEHWTATNEYGKVEEMVNEEMHRWKKLDRFPYSGIKIENIFPLLRVEIKLWQKFGILLILNDLDKLGSQHAVALLKEDWNSVLIRMRIQNENEPKRQKMAQKLVFVLYEIEGKAKKINE